MKFVAVTACPTGIAHSQMAAENLETTAEERGHDIHVEIHGAMGTENEIPADVLADADAAIIAADTSVQTDRFDDMVLVKGTVKDAVNSAGELIDEAIERVEGADAEASAASSSEASAADAGTADAADTGIEETESGGTTATDDAGGAETRGQMADSRDDGGLIARIKRLFS